MTKEICITIDFEKVLGRKRYTLKCLEFWGWTIGVHQGFSLKVSSYPSRTLALVSELSVTPSGNHIFYETLNTKHLQLSFYISYTLIHFKCHYGFSKNDFSRKFDQWWARQKKIFRIGYVVCQQFTFKIRCFWFTAAQTEARERMTSKEEPHQVA